VDVVVVVMVVGVVAAVCSWPYRLQILNWYMKITDYSTWQFGQIVLFVLALLLLFNFLCYFAGELGVNGVVWLDKYSSQFGGVANPYSYYHEEDESSFQLVDTSRLQKPIYQRGRVRFNQVFFVRVFLVDLLTQYQGILILEVLYRRGALIFSFYSTCLDG